MATAELLQLQGCQRLVHSNYDTTSLLKTKIEKV